MLSGEVAAGRAHGPVSAFGGGRRDLLSKFVRRNRWPVAFASTALLGLTVALIAVLVANARAEDARLRAEARFDDVRALAKILLFDAYDAIDAVPGTTRSEEHTYELQSLMRISYAVFCLKNKINTIHHSPHNQT